MISSHPDLQRIESISVLRDSFRYGEVWIGGGKELYSFSRVKDDSTAQANLRLIAEWRRERGIPGDEWQHVVLDSGGTLWAAGLKHVAVMQPRVERFIDRTILGADHQSSYGHAPLVEDPQGRMLASAGAGIARWSDGRWQFIGHGNGLTIQCQYCYGIRPPGRPLSGRKR